jgi:hypothetical protein
MKLVDRSPRAAFGPPSYLYQNFLMKPFLILAAILLATSGEAQKLKRIAVGKTGCSYLNYCDSAFRMEYSSDSSKVYTGECESTGVSYGLICVQLKNPLADLTTAEDLMIAYADYLQQNFTIVSTAGYTRGSRLNSSDSTRGITDYWVDSENDKWKIRAWTNGKFIGFMYAYSKKPVVEARVEEFFNGFRFGK